MSDDIVVHEKFLIKASSDELHNVLLLPFLHAIHDLDPKNEINIIVDQDTLNIFNAVPFKVNVFRIPKDKGSLVGRHYYSYNLTDVFNIDYFFEFTQSFKDLFLGTTFRAKNKIGFANWSNNFMLTHKVDETPLNSDSSFMKLYDSVDWPVFNKLVSKEGAKENNNVIKFPQKISKENSYILVIVPKLFIDQGNNKFIREIFDLFVGEKFVVFPYDVEISEEKDEIVVLKEFAASLDTKNHYIPATIRTGEILVSLLKDAHSVISEGSAGAILGSYFNKHSFALMKQNNFPVLKYFSKIPSVTYFDGSGPYRIFHNEVVTSVEDYGEFVDHFYEVVDPAADNKEDL